jgi:hypothetical protein
VRYVAAGEFQVRIVRVFETVGFDPERGTYRAVDIRFEYPEGTYHDLLIPLEEYKGPEDAKKRVKEWVEKYGRAIGPV